MVVLFGGLELTIDGCLAHLAALLASFGAQSASRAKEMIAGNGC